MTFYLKALNQNKINMKNIITVITIILFFASCSEAKKSATNDIGDKNTYVNYQDELSENPIGKEKKEAIAEATVSIENVISEGGPIIEFSNVVWDFGEIKQGESADHVFQFINTGSEPLIISNAKGSCGCTVPKWPKEPILPNSTGQISVQFNSGEKKGRQNKTVTLTTNCTPNTTILRVVGNILID